MRDVCWRHFDGRWKERRETRIENGKKAKKQSISQELYLNLTWTYFSLSFSLIFLPSDCPFFPHSLFSSSSVLICVLALFVSWIVSLLPLFTSTMCHKFEKRRQWRKRKRRRRQWLCSDDEIIGSRRQHIKERFFWRWEESVKKNNI